MTSSPSALDALLSTLRVDGNVATAHIDDGWMQGRTAYGGISSAVALAGTMALHPTEAPLRSAWRERSHRCQLLRGLPSPL